MIHKNVILSVDGACCLWGTLILLYLLFFCFVLFVILIKNQLFVFEKGVLYSGSKRVLKELCGEGQAYLPTMFA